MSWCKGFVKDKFLIFEHKKEYSVFMPIGDNLETLCGVIGINNPIEVSVPFPLPYFVETTLLPFKGRIINDSIIVPMDVSFKRGKKEFYEYVS